MMTLEMVDYEHEHAEWIRAEAVKIACQLHKYSPKIEEVLRDAEIVVDFIMANRRKQNAAKVMPLGIVPRDGGDAA